ncbi:MAG: PQQ-binding-like beta-propeller repeat protein, partial [Propionibacteriaceae bacterium]|nr:PQQ-binding-like beta-propeller repeat protein [Propionibacteriaceae bacterium]
MSDGAAEPLPSWPPPRTRPWWVPAVVVGICTCLMAAALFVADRVGQPTTSRVAAFLPADGAGWYGELRTQGASGASTATTVTESATIVGTAVTGGLDWGLAAQLIGAAGSNPIERTRFWRTTTTTIDAPRGEHQASSVYRIAADIALMVESGPGYAYTYTPNLVELPQTATAGASWQSHGAAGTASTYTAQFSAEAADGDCLRVVGTISYSGAAAGPTREVSRTWCPGQGIVSRSERANGVQLSDTRIARLPKPLTPNTTEPRYTWNPAQWQQHQLSSSSVDPTYGTGPMSGAPSAARPGMTASGVLIRTNTSGQDVMGFTPAKPAEWQSRWRAHPGGTVLTVTVYGDVVVATTSGRRAVGYTDTGVRLWELRLDEVVMTEPTRASDSEVALVTVGGEVVVADLASGQVRWHGTPGSDVGLSPV